MQSCDSTCHHCANNFFRWWKTREKQMSMPHKQSPAFNPNVLSSRIKVGVRVKYRHFEGTVISFPNYAGVDGGWRVTAEFDMAYGRTSVPWEWTLTTDEISIVKEVS